MNTPEQIATYFIESAPKKELCIDFDLQKMLDIYQSMRIETNFTEAALLVFSAAQIYSRKIDYLEQIILQMHKNDERIINLDKSEQIRKKNSFRPQKISNIFNDIQFSESSIKNLPSITTNLRKINKDKKSNFEKLLNNCAELRLADSKQKKMEMLKYLEYESNFHSTFTNLNLSLKNHIIDYESEELCGTRYDFRVHLNNVEERNGKLTVDYENLLLDYGSNNEFKTFLSPNNKQVHEITQLTELDNLESFMDQMISEDFQSSLNESTNKHFSQVDFNTDYLENGECIEASSGDVSFDKEKNDSDSDKEVADINCRESRISIDEGISVESIKSRSPSVSLYDCLNGFKKFNGIEKISFDAAMFTNTNDKNAELILNCIQLLEMNILKIPENKLRAKCNFRLPEEYKPNKSKKPKIMETRKRCNSPEEEYFFGFDDMSFFSSNKETISSPNTNIRNSSPISEADFLGFNDDDVDISFSNIKSSTVFENNFDASRTMSNRTSRDSGISDHSTENIKNHEENYKMDAHHDKYMQSVNDAKLLMEKVQNWHKQLKPILMESEKRRDFDIHEIGTQIIEAFSNDKFAECFPVISFETLMVSKEIDYTSNYFLSMLQLANSNNIEINVKNKSALKYSNKCDIELKLISRLRHHEEIENFSEEIVKNMRNKNNTRKRKQGVEMDPIIAVETADNYKFYNLDVAKSSMSVLNSESGYHSLDSSEVL